MDILDDFMESDRKPAPLGRRLLMRLVDLLLPLAALWAVSVYRWPRPLYEALGGGNALLCAFASLLGFRLLFLLAAGATPGMWVTRLELLSGEERPLHLGERFLAAFFVFYRGADYYLRKSSSRKRPV
ncbi:RDD family protein [Flaviaesturariibacter amylovorans]|uniref:RDD domain-containing protein n=1 Tax=Flaviaesturariibacter amylovorans TaxID=1084520 RepID=A0ABP8H2D5_9BACT